MKNDRGFTLLEAMITVTVLALLLVVGVPSFQKLLDRTMVRTTANDFLSSVLTARSEAIKREAQVILAQNGSSWSAWQVFIDVNRNGSYDSGEEVVLTRTASSGLALNSLGGFGNKLVFNPRGKATLSSTSDGLKVTKGQETRYVCFSATGRPRVQENVCS